MKIVTVVAAALLSGCAGSIPVYEMAAGYNAGEDLPIAYNTRIQCKDTLRVTAKREASNGSFVGLTHISSPSCGWPFNDKTEDWMSLVEIGIRFDGRGR